VIPPEVVALVANLLGRESWRRVSHGNDLAWESGDVTVYVTPDEEIPGVEIWTVEVGGAES
jgi:hypothetical protein